MWFDTLNKVWGRKIVLLIIVLMEVSPLTALADYDLTLTGVNDYNTPVLYSDKTILVDSNAFVRYSNLTLQNCTMDVNGSVECVSNLVLNSSVINVQGNFKGQPGLIISETGFSSIIATGDSTHTGTLTIEGEPRNPIKVNSDHVLDDNDFIMFEAESSTSSSLKFVDFYGGWSNVLIRNKRLNDAISNCRFFGADYAVYEEGPDEFTDVRFCFFYDNSQISVYANIAATGCGNPEMWLDNVVIDNAYEENSYGVAINGNPDEYCYGFFKMTNSIITNSFCGWGIGEYWYVAINFSNVAYYGNTWNDNLIDSNDFQTNPMFLTESPFEGKGQWPYFIKQNSPVAQVDLGYNLAQSAPQQLLTSLYVDSSPRLDKGMGFGVPILRAEDIKGDLDGNCIVNFGDFAKFAADWRTVKGVDTIHFPDSNGYSIADFDKDGIVDYFDLATLSANWIKYTKEGDLDTDTFVDMIDFSKLAMDWMTVKGVDTIHFPDANGYSISDFDKNGRVNTWDLAVFCANWLSTIPVPSIPLIISDSQDSLTVNALNIPGLEVTYYDFFLDGKYIASRDPNYNPTLVINKAKYSGVHYLEAVIRAKDLNDINNVNHYLSEVKSVRFNSPLHDLSFVEFFDPSRYYFIQGKLDYGFTVHLAIKNIEGENVWSGSYSGDFIAEVNPAVFSEISYDLIYNYQLDLQGFLNSFAESIINPFGGSVGGGGFPIMPLDGPPDYSTKGLVIAMLELGMTEGTGPYDTGSARYAAKMMKKVNVTPIVLRGYGGNNQVTLDTLRKVRNKYRWIRYMHIDSHGHYMVDGPGWFGFDVPRSVFLFNDGPWVAFNSRGWTEINLPIPSWYNNLRLSDAMEKAPCLWLLIFPEGQLKIVVSGACHTLRNIMDNPQQRYIDEWVDYGYQWEVRERWNFNPNYFYSDICRGLNLQTDNQVVLGSGEVIVTDTAIYPYWQYFFNTFWNSLGEGKAVPDALIDARDIAYDVVERNYRVRALGLINSNLRLVKDR